MARLLLTGGAGFIGSHTALVLLEAGHEVVVLDDFRNSSPKALERVQELSGRPLDLVAGSLGDRASLDRAFGGGLYSRGGAIDAVIHFAGLKAVGESVRHPLLYWDVNVNGSRLLLEAMDRAGCRTIVFSSSATLYGMPERTPIAETDPVRPINPYGHSKAAVERMLADLCGAGDAWRVASLRYFNPVGAHPSGRIGEDPEGIPNNLFPFVSQVAVGRRPELQVFGSDWPTHDGTGVRDYIHVMDLAEGHRAALDTLLREPPQLLTLNLGSGRGHSVLDVVRAFEAASGRPVPYRLVDRRPGDAAETVADPSLAAERLGWRTSRSLEDICRDGWAWQQANPSGYR
ncbi:MAG: UDP-glucose 4-epimerase GalE [Synechococcus sp. Tobar2m-G35]|nr:UDP-glucose 4-epimerase GalE [Synechococcus sp. Tobar2m-G35]